MIVIKRTKLYDPGAFGLVSTLHAYMVFLLSNAMTLALKNNTVLPLIMVIKYTKLYDPGAFGSISILPTWFFYKVMLEP
jgi:hypothetical protein